MPKPLTAPDSLMVRVNEEVWKKGLRRRPSKLKVSPFLKVQTHPNPWIPRGSEVWVAMCPADDCNGAEVVPADGPFLCGSCGVEAEVAW